jgi:phosphoglucosamine mutase
MNFFGTDGIRGRFGTHPLTPCVLKAFAHALADLAKTQGIQTLLMGRDTRASGLVIERFLADIWRHLGLTVHCLGILPTPALAFLTKDRPLSLGVMISASHNPAHDNGIKVFGPRGEKLNNESIRALEQMMVFLMAESSSPAPFFPEVGSDHLLWTDPEARQDYERFLFQGLSQKRPFAHLKVVIDGAHGACFRIAPAVFQALGAEVFTLGCDPNGTNINDQCGALFTSPLQEAVLAHGADYGMAFDGDGDRILLVDSSGQVVDGDQILGLLAVDAHQKEALPHQTVVSTLMANGALEVFLSQRGIRLLRTPVGDRFVCEGMEKSGAILGGEPSGHLILKTFQTSGDGLLVALQALTICQNREHTHPIFPLFTPYPTQLKNLSLTPDFNLDASEIQTFLHDRRTSIETEGGRLLVRLSGTEPLLRIFIESRDLSQVDHHMAELIHFFALWTVPTLYT